MEQIRRLPGIRRDSSQFERSWPGRLLVSAFQAENVRYQLGWLRSSRNAFRGAEFDLIVKEIDGTHGPKFRDPTRWAFKPVDSECARFANWRDSAASGLGVALVAKAVLIGETDPAMQIRKILDASSEREGARVLVQRGVIVGRADLRIAARAVTMDKARRSSFKALDETMRAFSEAIK